MNGSYLKTLELSGYITAANASNFQETLTESVRIYPHQSYLVDMDGVEFLDSAGLMVLVSVFRLAQSLGKQFSICSLAPSVKIIFELTQLDKVMPIYESREAFFRSLPQPIAA